MSVEYSAGLNVGVELMRYKVLGLCTRNSAPVYSTSDLCQIAVVRHNGCVGKWLRSELVKAATIK